MPSALEELLATLDRVLAKIDAGREGLEAAQARLEEAGAPEALGQLLGTMDEEAQQALALASDAAEAIVRSHQTLNRVKDTVVAYRTSLAREGASAAPPAPTSIQASRPQVGSPTWVAQEGRSIDPATEHVTTAVAYDSHGAVLARVQSGYDEGATRVQEELENAPLFPKPPDWKPGDGFFIASHAEPRLALWMRDTGVREATVLINKDTVCRGPYGCRRAVAALLPAGSAMTIISTVTGIKLRLKGART